MRIISYICPHCGWTGKDCEPDGPFETALYPVDDVDGDSENLDACPVCKVGDTPEKSIDIRIVSIVEAAL